MDPTVRQYEIPPPQIKVSWWRRIVLFLGIGCFTFIFRWIVEGIFHWGRQPMPESLFMPVALGAVLGLRFPKWLPRGGSLIIGEDFVEGRTQARWFTYKKRIRRDRIKSISEQAWLVRNGSRRVCRQNVWFCLRSGHDARVPGDQVRTGTVGPHKSEELMATVRGGGLAA